MQGEHGVAEPQGVGMFHGASDNKALIVSGCTSVHPYKYDVFLCSATFPPKTACAQHSALRRAGFLCFAKRLRRLLTCANSQRPTSRPRLAGVITSAA